MRDATRVLITLIVEDVCLAVVCIACFMLGHEVAGWFAGAALLYCVCSSNTFDAVRESPREKAQPSA